MKCSLFVLWKKNKIVVADSIAAAVFLSFFIVVVIICVVGSNNLYGDLLYSKYIDLMQ